MATFPTLTPSTRTFTPGRHPHSEIPTLNGLQTRVRTSNVIIEQQLRLTFLALTEAQMLSIRTHYIGQQGRFLSFAIPSSLLSGMTTPSYFTPTGYSWIYGAAPQVEDIPGTQRYTDSVELVTIPPEGANVNGAEFTVSVGLAAGVASSEAVGFDLTVTASIEGGVVADNSSAGFDLTVAVSFVGGSAFDTDAATYIAAVESADGQSLEAEVKTAINSFVVGCKADGFWAALKASCILAGARTLSGALVPLVGTAPTNNNFVSGDYSRETGLAGDGSTKYLNSNRNNNADPQNSNHHSAFITTSSTNLSHIIGSNAVATVGGNSIFTSATGGGNQGGCWSRSNGSTVTNIGTLSVALVNFIGTSRSSSSSFNLRESGSTSSSSVTSSTPSADSVLVFARGTPVASYTSARIAFYSIGESLDLALLDTRVTTLVNAIAAAIP